MICKNSPFPVARESHCLTAEASRAEGLLSISLTSATFKYYMIMGGWGQINRAKLSKGNKIEQQTHACTGQACQDEYWTSTLGSSRGRKRQIVPGACRGTVISVRMGFQSKPPFRELFLLYYTSLGALRSPTSRLRPFGPA